jgi:hypothetical protein
VRIPPRPLVVLAAALVLVLGAHRAAASTLGAYFDLQAQQREATQAEGAPLRFYLFAVLFGDPITAGLAGAEFRMAGFPPTWSYAVRPNPAAAVHLGDPLGDGCNIAFATCQLGPNVLLYTVDSVASDAREDVVYRIVAHRAPSNPQIPCPVLVGCDPPDPPRGCVTGLESRVNSPDAVEAANWACVKALFQH